MEETKTCTKCGRTKPLNEFGRDARRKDGFVSRCRVCTSEYQSNYYLENRDELSIKRTKYRADHTEEITAYHVKYREKHRDKLRAANVEYYKTHSEERANYYIEHRRNTMLYEQYGVTSAEYTVLLDAQGGRCAICSKTQEENGRFLAVDHDHKTGETRGLLCSSCNSGLGFFQDSPKICILAASYLESYRRKEK